MNPIDFFVKVKTVSLILRRDQQVVEVLAQFRDTCVSILSEIAVVEITLAEGTEAFEVMSFNIKKESYAREREASLMQIFIVRSAGGGVETLFLS